MKAGQQRLSSPSPLREEDQTRPPSLLALACVAITGLGAVVIVSGFVLSYVLARGINSATQQQDIVDLACHSPGCLRFEGLLTMTLNASVDPCHDFKAYVTSRWLPDPYAQVSERWKYQWHVKYNWMRDLADEIRNGRHFPESLRGLITTSFQACENRSLENADETRTLFKQLMRNLSIPWPHLPPRHADPFEVHLNLCIRWNMPLWFDMDLLPDNGTAGRKTIYIGPSVYAQFWAGQYRLMDSDSAVQRYIDQYLAYFYDEDTRSSAEIVDYNAVFNITKQVVYILAEVHKNTASTFLTLDSAARAFGQKPDRFASLLNEHFHLKVSFMQEDIVIEKKKSTIEVARHIVASYAPTMVLSHLGWWMLQIYAPIADAKFFIQKYGSEEVATLLRPLFCETQTESSFKLLLLSSHASLHFPQQKRQGVQRLLNNVRNMTAVMYEQSNMSIQAKTRAVQMLRNMSVNLWPSAKYQTQAELERVYSSHYTNRTSMLYHWITERRASAGLIGSDAYFEDKRLPHAYSKDPIYYDSLLNAVSMSMLAVREPFYYDGDDWAVNYGGLGAAFARSILEGLGNKPASRNESFIEATRNSIMQRDHQGVSYQSLDLGTPSFLPAFQVFKAHRQDPSRIRGLSPDQIFFIVYCHTQTRLWAAFDCNAALRGATNFVDAFHCKQSSRINR